MTFYNLKSCFQILEKEKKTWSLKKTPNIIDKMRANLNARKWRRYPGPVSLQNQISNIDIRSTILYSV